MILVNQPIFTGREKELLLKCIDDGWVSSDGPFVEGFEEKFSKYIGMKYGVAVCNGSVALEVALWAAGIRENDEVIVPSFTIISCVNAILRCGAKPILVDVDKDTWTMDVEQVAERITPRTKAVMAVHMYGHPVDMDPLLKIANERNIIVIEDAAEAHGAEYKGRKCGSMGSVSSFSFYSNKVITTGEGGMVLTNDERIAQKAKSYRNLCFIPEQRFLHYEFGNNYRLSNLQAALGIAQLEKIEYHLKLKKEIGETYTKELSRVKGVTLQKIKSWAKPIYWVFGFVLDDEIPMDAKMFIKELSKRGIQTRPFFWGMHEQPVFLKLGLFKHEKYPVTEKLARRGLYLPSGLGLKHEDILKVTEEVKDIVCSL